MAEMNYKGNSHKSKETGEQSVEKKKVEKVVNGKVKVKKKSEFRKLADIFIPEDIGSVKDYIISEVIVPAIKKTVSEIVDSVLYPDGNPKKKYSGGRASYTRYYERGEEMRRATKVRAGYNCNDITFESRGEAELVLDKMIELVDVYGVASVADLYDLAGISNQSTYTDNKYGWSDLRTADIIRLMNGEGFMLKMPRPVPLN